MDINAIENVFRENNLDVVYKHPYFKLEGFPGWDDFSFYIDSRKAIIVRSSSTFAMISIDVSGKSSTEIAINIIEEIRNFIQFEESEKEVLSFAHKTLSGICDLVDINQIPLCLWVIFYMVYKVDGVYQRKLQILLDNPKERGYYNRFIMFDLTNKSVQICTNTRIELYEMHWWKSNIEYQPNKVLYKLDLSELTSNITPTTLAKELVNLDKQYYNYVLWATYNSPELDEFGKLYNTKNNKSFLELSKKLKQYDNLKVYISNDLSPFVKSTITIVVDSIYDHDGDEGEILFKILIGGKTDIPSLVRDFGSGCSNVVNGYRVTGLDDVESAIDFINSYILGDKLKLDSDITNQLSTLLHDEDYYQLTKSFLHITAEVDYSTEKFKRVICSQYISLSEGVDFILEITSKEDGLYYSILNSIKGDIVNIPITNLLRLTDILKGYVLGSYKSLPDSIINKLCEDGV